MIDIDDGAHRLYQRQGFVATKTEHFRSLRWLFGFGGSTTMSRRGEDTLAAPDDVAGQLAAKVARPESRDSPDAVREVVGRDPGFPGLFPQTDVHTTDRVSPDLDQMNPNAVPAAADQAPDVL